MKKYALLACVLLACSSPSPEVSELPPVPLMLPTADGGVPVIRQRGLMVSDSAYGTFDWTTRSIKIDASLAGIPAWLTIEHERVHLILADAGVQVGDEELEDRICDAIAAARVAEMIRARRGK